MYKPTYNIWHQQQAAWCRFLHQADYTHLSGQAPNLHLRAQVLRISSQSKPHRSLLDDRLRKNRVPHALHSVFGPAHQAFRVSSRNFAQEALSAEHLTLSGVTRLWDRYATVGC